MLKVESDTYLTPEGGVLHKNIYVVSDLHIGIEESYLSLVRIQTQEMMERLERAFEKYSFDTIILNGDVKHSYGKEITQEWEEIREFDEFLESLGVRRIYVKGNHDKYLENILRAETVREFETPSLYVTHGDKEFNLKPEKVHVIGNEHPSLKIRDELGKVWSMPAFLHAEEGLIVTPAFNPLSRGENVLSLLKGHALSPILKKINVEKVRVYAVVDWEEIYSFGNLGDLAKALR